MGHESFSIPGAPQPQEVEFGETLYADDFVSPEKTSEAATEVSPSEREPWNPEEDTRRYQERLSSLRTRQQEIEDALTMIHEDEYIASRFNEDQMQELFNNRENLRNEILSASANYPGDWTLLLRDRMLDPIMKERFIAQRTEAMLTMKPGSPAEELSGAKYSKEYGSHYQAQIDNYDARVETVFSQTQIGTAAEHGKSPRNLGQSNIDQVGTVFTDAEHKGTRLTSRQMNIVEAHEKGHGLRDYTSPLDSAEIKSVIDGEALLELTTEYRRKESLGEKEGRFRSIYVERPDEIIERMAQFKNYFGMGVKDKFEKKHLDYIREHYVLDTGLDNGVTDLLTCITPGTEMEFLSIINKYPL